MADPTVWPLQQCEGCGVMYEARLHQGKRPRRACSRACGARLVKHRPGPPSRFRVADTRTLFGWSHLTKPRQHGPARIGNQGRPLRPCAQCGVIVLALGRPGPATLCSPECRGAARAARRRRDPSRTSRHYRDRARRYGVSYDSSVTRRAVLDRAGWRCHLCLERIPDRPWTAGDEEYGTIDHIVPMVSGGDHVWGNVHAAHMICNARRGADAPSMAARFFAWRLAG